MMRLFFAAITAAAVAGCSNLSVQGGASLGSDAHPDGTRQNLATAEIMLTHEHKDTDLSVGYRHMSNVDEADKDRGFNGAFVELRTRLVEF